MRTSRAAITIAAAVLAATALTGVAMRATAYAAVRSGHAGAGSCTPSWRLVTLPEPPGSTVTGLSDAEMLSADVRSSRDVLFTGTVDFGGDPALLPGPPWVLRWDGHEMSQAAPFPRSPWGASSSAYASSFDSGTDGWMLTLSSSVGLSISAFGLTGYSVGTAEHWHDSRWVLTPTAVPADPHTGVELTSVVALSPDNAWAVGYFYQAEEGVRAGVPSTGVAVEHWDGTQWSLAANPAGSVNDAALNAVTALSPTDIWAVGGQVLTTNDQIVPFAEHFDGTAWHVVPVPPGNQNSRLNAVSAASAGDVWAVGAQTEPGTSDLAAPLAEHWDGTAWTVAALPDVGNALLSGVYAAGHGQVWAGGEFGSGAPQVFLHRDGAAWTSVPVPGPKEYNVLYTYAGLGGSGPGDVWAAGRADNFAEATSTPIIAHLSCG